MKKNFDAVEFQRRVRRELSEEYLKDEDKFFERLRRVREKMQKDEKRAVV